MNQVERSGLIQVSLKNWFVLTRICWSSTSEYSTPEFKNELKKNNVVGSESIIFVIGQQVLSIKPVI